MEKINQAIVFNYTLIMGEIPKLKINDCRITSQLKNYCQGQETRRNPKGALTLRF